MKIVNASNEEIIFSSLRQWVLDNFQLISDVGFSVSGKNQTLNFNMKDYRKEIYENTEKIKKIKKLDGLKNEKRKPRNKNI